MKRLTVALSLVACLVGAPEKQRLEKVELEVDQTFPLIYWPGFSIESHSLASVGVDVKSFSLEETLQQESGALMIEASYPLEPETAKVPQIYSLRLAQKKDLSREEFDALRSLVQTPEDFRQVVRFRGVHYPKDSEALSYLGPSSALTTHRLGQGICTDLANYFAAFFVDKEGYELYDVSLRFVDEWQGHQLIIYKGPNGRWGYADNLSVYPLNLSTQDQVVLNLKKRYGRIGFEVEEVTIIGQVVSGPWIHDDNKWITYFPWYKSPPTEKRKF
ncbi:TPA: hypothetical protein HA241_04545 [Candidatus Woesearchaeota archaeon]|nr:hypothetical protein [Candidatus Woesearchaeota archaeon]